MDSHDSPLEQTLPTTVAGALVGSFCSPELRSAGALLIVTMIHWAIVKLRRSMRARSRENTRRRPRVNTPIK
jgi:hypothetical protein